MTAARDDNALSRLADGVIARWPSHRKFLERSLTARSSEVMAATLDAAALIERLVGDEINRFVAGYRWFCEMVIAEEVIFRRTGNYRYSSFADANREVYQNAGLMARYMDGVLLSHVLWSNHAQILSFFVDEFLHKSRHDGQLLEVGPGHGLLLALAATESSHRRLSGWDVSETSLQHTDECLKRLGVVTPTDLHARSVSAIDDIPASFDSVVISEVCEHLEQPIEALKALRRVMLPSGRIFVHVPVNAPAIDHIYLLRTPEEVIDLVQRSGYAIETSCVAPAAGYTEAAARKLQAAISVAVIGVNVG